MPQDPQEPVGPPLVDDPDVAGADEDVEIGPDEALPKTDVIPRDEQVDPLP